MVASALLKPDRVVESLVASGTHKAHAPFVHQVVLSILAGVYIGLAATTYLIILGGLLPLTNGTDTSPALPGISKLLASAIFPFGLVLVELTGAQMITSNMAFVLLCVITMQGTAMLYQLRVSVTSHSMITCVFHCR